MIMVMMMMMSIFKAHDSMSFNAQCAEGDKRKKKREVVIMKTKK